MRIVTSNEDFDALEKSWMNLHAVSGLAAFQSFPWQRVWWKHFARKNLSLYIIVVESLADGRIVAIFPCVIERARIAGVLPLRRLWPLGRGVTDYLEMLVLPQFREPACQAVAEAIRQAPCDVAVLTEVPDGSPLHRVLELLAQAGFATTRRVREQCPRTQLLGTWDDTLATFSKSHRKSLSYMERRLGKTFEVEFRNVGREDDLAAELSAFMEMHQRRWNSVGEPGAFADPTTGRFHLEVAQELHERGWLLLAFLLLDGKPASSIYAFKLAGQLQFYLSGQGEDESVRKYSPGIALHIYNMQQMIAEGVTVYDFLRGTEQYKYDLGAADVPLWHFTAVRGSARSAILYRLTQAVSRLGDRIKAARAGTRRTPAQSCAA